MSPKALEIKVEQKVTPAYKIITGVILGVIGVLVGSLIIALAFFFGS